MKKLVIAYFISLSLNPYVLYAQPLYEQGIRNLVTGNTLTGRSTEGRYFSEYHLPDGRVLGDNGYYINTDACWIVKSNQICYYYGQEKNRNIHCFALEKSNDIISMRFVPPNPQAGTLDAFAKIEKDNPRNHSDNGKKWLCDGLISNLKNKASNIVLAQMSSPSLNQHDKKTPFGAISNASEFRIKENITSDRKLPPGQIPQPLGQPKFNKKADEKSNLTKNIIRQPVTPQKINQHRPVKNYLQPQPQFRSVLDKPFLQGRNSHLTLGIPKNSNGAKLPMLKSCQTAKPSC
jgi:hypothetical protein